MYLRTCVLSEDSDQAANTQPDPSFRWVHMYIFAKNSWPLQADCDDWSDCGRSNAEGTLSDSEAQMLVTSLGE